MGTYQVETDTGTYEVEVEDNPSVTSASVDTSGGASGSWGESDPPSLLKDPVGALTSKDWWLTRPSGEKITPQQALIGAPSHLLNGLTLGAGDEITAGVASGIDALGGSNLSDAYDQRLAEVRGADKSFTKAAPIAALALDLAGASKLPLGTTVNRSDGIIKSGIKTGLEAGSYGLANGFMSGEGGVDNRAENALDNAISSAGIGAALGAGSKAIANTGSAIANMFGGQGLALQRKSIGTNYNDYKLAANDIGIKMMEDGQYATATENALNDIIKNGELGTSRNPKVMTGIVKAKEEDLSSKIDDLIRAHNTKEVHPTFNNTLSLLESGKIPGDQIDSLLGKLGKIEENLRTEGKGSLLYLQQQKIGQGKRWDPNDTALNEFNRAVYNDLQTTLEQHVPGLNELNAELQKWKVVKPIVQRGVAQLANQTLDPRSFTRTTGGYGSIIVPSLTGLVAGGVGAGVGGPLVGLATAAGAGLATTNKGKQILGSALTTSSNALNKIDIPTDSLNAISAVFGKPSLNDDPAKSTSLLQQNLQNSLQQPQRIQSQLPLVPRSQSQVKFPSLNATPPADSIQHKAITSVFGANPVKKQDITAIESKIDANPFDSAVYEAESGRNPTAKNPISSAKGAFQLTSATAKALGVKDVFDLGQNYEGFQKLTAENRARFGDDPTLLYSAHYLGAPLLAKVLKGKELSAQEQAQVDYLKTKALPDFLRIYNRKTDMVET